MKQTTICLLSGFFGALFAVACGVGKTNADGGLTKSVYEVDCADALEDVDDLFSWSDWVINIGRTVPPNASVSGWSVRKGEDVWKTMGEIDLQTTGWLPCYGDRELIYSIIIIE